MLFNICIKLLGKADQRRSVVKCHQYAYDIHPSFSFFSGIRRDYRCPKQVSRGDDGLDFKVLLLLFNVLNILGPGDLKDNWLPSELVIQMRSEQSSCKYSS